MLIFFIRTPEKNYIIEMDRFVHKLSGNTKEVIKRLSSESAATLKHLGVTIKK